MNIFLSYTFPNVWNEIDIIIAENSFLCVFLQLLHARHFYQIGNSEHVAQAFREINPICDCSWSNQMPYSNKKNHKLFLTCATCSELPSNISTMSCM